jgi:hypothetical protein
MKFAFILAAASSAAAQAGELFLQSDSQRLEQMIASYNDKYHIYDD